MGSNPTGPSKNDQRFRWSFLYAHWFDLDSCSLADVTNPAARLSAFRTVACLAKIKHESCSFVVRHTQQHFGELWRNRTDTILPTFLILDGYQQEHVARLLRNELRRLPDASAWDVRLIGLRLK